MYWNATSTNIVSLYNPTELIHESDIQYINGDHFNGARKDYIALGLVPAFDDPAATGGMSDH